MQHTEHLVDTLNELVRINYDRIRGYEKAIEDVENIDVDLKALFNTFANQSREYLSHWQNTIRGVGGEPVTDSTFSGKLFRVWMDFKATVTGHGRKAILESCVFGENAALEAYEDALGTEGHLPDDIRQEIASQKAKLQSAHDTIKSYADMHEKVS